MENGKLARMFSGPCRIISKAGANSYRLQNLQSKKIYRRHVRHLRPLSVDTPAHSRYNQIDNGTINNNSNQRDNLEIVDHDIPQNVLLHMGDLYS